MTSAIAIETETNPVVPLGNTLALSPIPTHGTLRYISPGITPTPSPYLYHLPALSEFGDVRSVPMTNIKASIASGDQSPYTLRTHGFTARRIPSALHSEPYDRSSWHDEDLLQGIYIAEVEDMLKHLTGASTIVTEMVLVRSQKHSEVDALATSETKSREGNTQDPKKKARNDWPKLIGVGPGAGASPAPKVHLDFSPAGARTHIRKYHDRLTAAAAGVIAAEDQLLTSGLQPKDLAERYDGPRWAMYSIWRPLQRVRRDPLAFADRRSFPKSDYVPVPLMMPTGQSLSRSYPTEEKGHSEESLLAYANPRHEWYWIWDMEPEEVVVIELFDSDADKKGYCGVMHSSVEAAGTENEPARESIEVRCTAIWQEVNC